MRVESEYDRYCRLERAVFLTAAVVICSEEEVKKKPANDESLEDGEKELGESEPIPRYTGRWSDPETLEDDSEEDDTSYVQPEYDFEIVGKYAG